MNKENEFLKIVYNGEDVALNEQNAAILAQKGMNYDKLFEKYNKLKEDYEKASFYKEKIEEIAKDMKISADEVLESFHNEYENINIQEYSLKNNIPVEKAKTIKDMEKRIALLEKEKEELIPYKKRQEELKELKKAYPHIDEKSLDSEILKVWEESGRPLKDVYNEITLKKLISEKAALKANEENLIASAGSVSGIPDKEEEYTDDMVRKMSDKEFNRNFERILKQYKKGEK